MASTFLAWSATAIRISKVQIQIQSWKCFIALNTKSRRRPPSFRMFSPCNKMFISCEFQAKQQTSHQFIQNIFTNKLCKFPILTTYKTPQPPATSHSSQFSFDFSVVRETRVNQNTTAPSLWLLHKTHRIIGLFLANLFRRSSQRNISFRLLLFFSFFFHRNYFIAARPFCAIIAFSVPIRMVWPVG